MNGKKLFEIVLIFNFYIFASNSIQRYFQCPFNDVLSLQLISIIVIVAATFGHFIEMIQ